MYKGVDLSSVRLTLQQCQAIKAAGYDFIGKYLVPETYTSGGVTKQSTKSLSAQDVKNILAAGLRILSIYETSAGRAKGGRAYGLVDGMAALQRGETLGMPTNGIIYFAVDYDAPTSDFDKIEAYLRAAREQTGPYEVGVYGSYKVIEEMYRRGACKAFWQCVAWSGGKKSVHRNIYQSEWDKTVAGITVDINECMDMDAAGLWSLTAEKEQKEEETAVSAKYSEVNGIHIVEVPVSQFRILMTDAPKKTAVAKNYANAGFFTASTVTAPVSMLKCDLWDGYTLTKPVAQESTVSGKKLTHQQASWDKNYYGKVQTVLGVKGGKASVFEATYLSSGYDYAIAGVPIMRGGNDVAWKTFCAPQGWYADTVRATWHTMLGIKSANADKVFVIGIKTTKSNTVLAAEAFTKLKALGFYDVICLDGGGSFHFVVDGKAVATIGGNRRINSVVTWGSTDTSETGKADTAQKNPYTEPAVTLKKGSTGAGVKWLQWQLNYKGFNCGSVDGVFGNGTLAAVKAFQKARGLAVDGYVGPATRAALKA